MPCVRHPMGWRWLVCTLVLSGLLSAVRRSAAPWQLELNARQWNGNKQSENLRGVKTWRTYHNTASKPRPRLSHPPPSPLPHTFILPSSFSFTDLYLLCLWQQAVFAERLSPRCCRRHCPTHQPLLTFDLDNSTCPLTHTLFTPLVLLALSTSDIRRLSVQLINRYNSLWAEPGSVNNEHSGLCHVVH